MADTSTDTITANQAYVASGGAEGTGKSFADWLADQKNQGIIKEGADILASWFKKPVAPVPGVAPALPVNKIMGIPQKTFIIGAVALVVIVTGGIMIYRHSKKRK